MTAFVKSINISAKHSFSKARVLGAELLAGIGIVGDAHAGKTVKHRYLRRKNKDAPNLRQVHLIHTELFDELKAKGFDVLPGDLGENITTEGLDILALPTGTILEIGEAKIKVTGLREPCVLIDRFKAGLMKAVLDKDEDGNLIRKAGIMSVVERGGKIKLGDEIIVHLPDVPHIPLSIV